MQEWFNTTMHNLQSGDISTGIMVLVGLLVLFFVIKILSSTFKAILIVAAVIVIIAVLIPEAGVIDKAKDFTEKTTDYVKENVTKESIEALKDKATDLTR